MKKTFVFAALCAAAIAVSCNKNVIDEPVVNNNGKMTLTCVIDPGTKLGIDNAGKTTWEVGDEILIHGEYTKEGYCTTVALAADNISADGKTATFTIDGVTPYDRTSSGYKSNLYAAFPASAVVMENHCYWNTRFTETNHPLMAGCNNGNTIIFRNLCGVISFRVSGSFDSYTLTGNSDEVVGYSPYQTRIRCKDDESISFDKVRDGDDFTSVSTKKVSGSLVADGNTDNFIFLPTGTNFAAGFTINFYDGEDLVKVAKTSTAVNVGRSELLVLGDITSKLENYVAPTSSDHKSAITGATDITSGNTANCYIVNSPGAYKFPAVKGNSATEAGNVFGVELLWETCNTGDDLSVNDVIAAVDFEDNWIYFKTPDVLRPGNALIAAKNAQDNIIWSWHIWVPATPVGVGGENFMDRNLGALSAPVVGPIDATTFGLVYQWGRKDPFPGPASAESSSPAKVAGTAISVVHDDTTPQGSLALATLNPTVLYNANNIDWSSSENNSLWKDGDAKTMYDPCPAGYRVPIAESSPIVFAADIAQSAGWLKDETNLLFTVGSDPALVFPLGGYIDDYSASFSFSKIGVRVAIWAADAASGSKGSVLDVRFDKGTQGLSSTAKSRAAYVRCQVDK